MLDGDVRDTHVVPELILPRELVEEPVEVGVARPELRAVVPSRSALISITHQAAEGRVRLARLQLLQDHLARLPGDDDPRVNDHICRQLLQSLEMVAKGLLDDASLFEAGCTHVPLEQLLGRPRDQREDLGFVLHGAR